MAGAIIPDDWDGETFECNRVVWPASQKWRAILLGQMTEPSGEFYWDADTGDEEEAAIAVQDAYRLTIPAIYSEECGDLPALIPRVAFKAYLSAGQAIPAATFTKVEFDTLAFAYNSPGFDTTFHWHSPTDADLFGLWLYSVQISAPVNPAAVRMKADADPEILARQAGAEGFCGVTFVYPHSVGDLEIEAEVWLPSAATLLAGEDVTYFYGVFLGAVVG